MRRFFKVPFNAALAYAPVRRRIIFELRHRYYAELQNEIPLGHDLRCPLVFPEAWSSFAEIFVQGEYGPAFDALPLPERWIDLGCHAGFFSLYVLWRRAQMRRAGRPEALLVDADSRMALPVEELLRINRLHDRLVFAHGVIARGDGVRDFRERGYMASSVADLGPGDGALRRVPVLTAVDLIARFRPPYDLVKVDIEGSEFDFVTGYDALLGFTKAVLLEWHASDHQGRGPAALGAELHRRGFRVTREISTTPHANGSGPRSPSVLLFIKEQ